RTIETNQSAKYFIALVHFNSSLGGRFISPSSSTPPTPPAASRATACAPIRCLLHSSRVLHPSRVERRAPAALVIPRKLKVVALVCHADRDPADAGPGVEPGPQCPEREVVGRARKPGEAERC